MENRNLGTIFEKEELNITISMRLLIVRFIFLVNISLYAQVDSEENSVPIPVVEDDKGDIEALDSKPIENNGMTIPQEDKVNGLSVPKQNNTLDQPKKEFSMLGGEQFGNPGELYVKQIKKHAQYTEQEENSRNNGNTTNQYLGDFKTKAGKVNVIYRDHQYPDGDRIRVFVNDNVIQPNVLLHTTYSGFKLDLQKGFNKIDFLALNQGTSGPNTAEFQILDEHGNVISTNQWNLATGVKATIILIKE